MQEIVLKRIGTEDAEQAQNENLQYVWLGVWEKNIRAVKFYKKNGFVEFDKHIFKFGDEDQTALKKKLK